MANFGLICETLSKIGATPSTNEKLVLFEALLRAEPAVEEIVRYTYNPLANYYVTPDMPVARTEQPMSDEQMTSIWANVKLALDAMTKRELSGNDAKRAMQMVLESMPSAPQAFLFFSIFNRDLRIGMAVKTFARYFKGLVADARPYLCKKHDMIKDPKLAGLRFPLLAESKWDGCRSVVIVDENGVPEALSRELKPFYNWEHIGEAIKKAGLRSVVLDGEFGVPADFTLTNAILRTQKKHPRAKDIVYFLFDAMPLKHWQSGGKDQPLLIEARKEMVKALVMQVNSPLVQETPSILVRNVEEFRAAFDAYVEAGLEGVVLKRPGSPYRFDGRRDENWEKAKPVQEDSLVCTGASAGDTDGQYANTCGKLLFKGYAEYDGQVYYTEGRAGSGLTPKDRDKYWQMHLAGTLAGMIIECQWQEPCQILDQNGREVISYNSKGERIWSLRFPIFKRERPDQTAEALLDRSSTR